jgi:hypothetical protein
MGNAIPTTTTTDDGANLPESPKLSPRAVAVFEAKRRMAQLKVMTEIENIITKNYINVSNIQTAVEEIVKRWGDKFEYDAKDLLRIIHDRIKSDQIKQFTTPELTNDQVDKIKEGMMEFAEDVAQAKDLAAKLKINAEARERAKNIADGWTINPRNPGGPLDSPGGGSKKKRRTGKKAKGKMRKNSRTIKKNGTKNIKQNQIQQ